jgi:hypothetical protein
MRMSDYLFKALISRMSEAISGGDPRAQLRILAAWRARGLPEDSPTKVEGAGKTGCALHPRSRVQLRKKSAHTSIQVQRRASGLPCAMVLRRTSCSSRCANSFSHRCQRIDGWSWPGWARASSADVTPATGARTTRLGRTRHAPRQSLDGLGTLPPKSDARRFSIGRRRAVRSLTKPQEGPPCDDVCAPDAAASTAPRPAFSDDRETPLCRGRDTGSCMGDLGLARSGLFLREIIF